MGIGIGLEMDNDFTIISAAGVFVLGARARGKMSCDRECRLP